MAIRITSTRPTIYWDSQSAGSSSGDGDYCHDEVIGTTPDWDWLFAGPLKGQAISSIKLIRQLNPGIGLKDAKDAFEAMRPYWDRHNSGE